MCGGGKLEYGEIVSSEKLIAGGRFRELVGAGLVGWVDLLPCLCRLHCWLGDGSKRLSNAFDSTKVSAFSAIH